ncbi:hypothetical protein L2E82_00627 [Cichorium intybus]|uniref:Uncharacterized protein n=1 Tax=Cichorium intybus TaxID=13427 RepID=A0ACB9GXH2_CICIN|nr:hypothetical protein L2E82_00627 [Cichorium intybus]
MILVGEIIDIDKLRSLPLLIDDEGIPDVKAYYYGGLYVMLHFGMSTNAKGFLENELCWKKLFKWLKPGAHAMDLKFQRLAWLRMVGLPLHFCDSGNIKKIVTRFGDLVDMEDRMWDSANLSNFKHPFSMNSFSQQPTVPGELDDETDHYESEDKSDEEDAISDTWNRNSMGNEPMNDASEDGEILLADHADGDNVMAGDCVEPIINATINVLSDKSNDNTVVEESCVES